MASQRQQVGPLRRHLLLDGTGDAVHHRQQRSERLLAQLANDVLDVDLNRWVTPGGTEQRPLTEDSAAAATDLIIPYRLCMIRPCPATPGLVGERPTFGSR
jgi:hypothetical protein